MADRESREVQSSAEWKLVIPQDSYIPGPVQDKPVCNLTEQPTGQVHQLETRPGSHADECLSNQLEGTGGVCIPSLCFDRQMPTEDQSRTEYNCVSGTSMAEPSKVLDVIGPSGGTSHSPSLLLDPKGQTHPLVCFNRLRLAACKVSDDSTQQWVFQETLQLCYLRWSTGTNSAY